MMHLLVYKVIGGLDELMQIKKLYRSCLQLPLSSLWASAYTKTLLSLNMTLWGIGYLA